MNISQQSIHSALQRLCLAISLAIVLVGLSATSVFAIEQIPDPEPDPGSYGLAATKTKEPPKQGAVISTPNNGASFGDSPITVSGICPDGLLVEILNNGVMVGSVMCENGGFNLQVSLFSGVNELQALVYDSIGQTGPKSSVVEVTFNNTDFDQFAQELTLTSDYGRRSAPVGQGLTWPFQLSGGNAPYAISIDWGDGSLTELQSQATAGRLELAHAYEQAGFYTLSVRVTDSQGVSAFLQVVAVASGDASATPGDTKPEDSDITVITKILWIPIVVALLLLLPAFWLGRRSQIIDLRNRLKKERDDYKE